MSFQIPYSIPLSTYRPFVINGMLPYLGGSAAVINQARSELNIHPSQEVGFTYLAAETPTLAGVVQDETPTRKDRTRLSCRASDFDSINQSFSGGNTSTGKTALSVFAWVRPSSLSGSSKTIIAEYQSSGNDISFAIYFYLTKLRVIVSSTGTTSKDYYSTEDFTVDEFAHVGFVASVSGNSLKLYRNGKEIPVVKSTDLALSAIHDSSQNLEVGSLNGGANYFNGQIQQPLIYEGVWTPAEVRDLYLGKYDAITAPTYGWFLDADTAHPLTSASPALTPTNSPDIYEDDAVPVDWLNEKGWNPVTKFDGDLITITDGLEVDFSKDVKIKMSVNYTTLSNSMELFEFAPNKNARTHFTTRLLWVLTGTGDVTTTGGDPTFTSNVWYDLEFNFIASSGTMTISVNDVVKATLAGQSPTTLQTLNRIGGGSTPLTALVSGFEVYEDNIKIFRLDGLVDSVGGLPLTIGAGISELNYPKRWDEELDSLGNVAANSESFGVARRDGQLVGSSNCISLDGVNQYGTMPDDSFAGHTGDMTIEFSYATANPIGYILDINATQRMVLEWTSSELKIFVGGAPSANVAIPVDGTAAKIKIVITGTTAEVFQDGVSVDAVTIANAPDFTNPTSVLAVGSRFSFTSQFADQEIWGLKAYTDSTTLFELPMAEGSGTTSYDVSGSGKNCTWVNSPTWGNQSSYFWNENQGCSAIWDVTSATDAAAGPEVVGAPIETGVSISLEIKTTDSRGMLFGNNAGTSPFGLIWSNGDVTTSLTIGMGTPTITIDGIVYTDGVSTRDDLNSVISTGAWVTIELTGVDTSSFSNGLFLSGVYVSNWTWNGQVRNLVINGEPFDGPLLIPALAAGTNDANGGALTNPAGPWLYEGLGSTYVNFDVVPNANQWLEQRWIDASFNGTTSYLSILNTGTTIFQFDDVWEYQSLLFTSDVTTQGFATVGSATEGFTLTGGTSIQTHFGAGYQDINVGYTRNEENDLTISMDGSGTTLTASNINDTNGLTENSRVAAFTQVGKADVVIGLKAGSYWNGEMRQLKYTHEGTVYFDTPLLGCSLDLSSQVNHGTDTDITYNRLTDVSYTAGATVSQPFSVNDATAGRVSELVQFTFPVTTLSNTPTISQTVYEDGNTITEDSLPIYES